MPIALPLTFLPAVLALALPCSAAELDDSKTGKTPNDKTPSNVSLADDPQTAIKKMRVTLGLKVDVWAAEPLIQNAVSFAFDEHGRCYVVETHRRRTSVFDIRNFKDWVDSDLALRTPEQRAEFLKQNVSETNAYFMDAIMRAKSGNFGDFNKDGRIDWHDMELESERIRLVWDSTGAGVADKATTFAEGFNSIISGVAAGVMVNRGDVYFTCIPDVWKLKAAPHPALSPSDGERVAEGRVRGDSRTRLHGNFGVHIAYGGHDMHGLKMGPDGKVYWTIADRGFAPPADIKGYGFTTEFLRRTLPDCGAVYRCDPDGANLEVVCVGLRNPQELAFDQFGNLFTVDNNADGGDKARVEYIVEGADYGWRYGWQHMPKLGPWNTEMLWGLTGSNTALYSLPPVAHVTHGPAGFAYYPGTGLPARFNDHFFIADFPGGVRYFQMKPDGAGFTVDNPDNYLQDNKPDNMAGKLLWNLYPTDVDFPPGGGIAVLDWVYGWEKTGKGRIYKLHDPAMVNDAAVAETKRLLSEGMEKRSIAELGKLLGHSDQRVRLESQWALVDRLWRGANGKQMGGPGLEAANAALEGLASHCLYGGSHLGKLHGIWGLGQVLPKLSAQGKGWSVSTSMSSLLMGLGRTAKKIEDYDQELWAQLVHYYGDKGEPMHTGAEGMLLQNVTNASSARVKFVAAQGIGKKYAHSSVTSQRRTRAIDALIALLHLNADHDPYLRHAGVCALVNIGDTNAILTAARDSSASVRLAALLAMRRLEMPEVAQFLTDADPRLVLEAARAINDAPIESAMPQLAALLSSVRSSRGNETPSSPTSPSANLRTSEASLVTSTATEEFTLRRAINANFRLGKIEHAQNLIAFAEKTNASEALRAEAISTLGDWAAPSGRDHIVGLWRPLPAREARAASLPLRTALDGLLKSAPESVRVAAIEAATKLKLADAAPSFFQIVSGTALTPAVRAAALRALSEFKDARLKDALTLATADKSEALRKEASKLLGTGDAGGAVATLTTTLTRGSVSEQQSAYEALASIKGKDADSVIRKALDQLVAGKLRRELALDVLSAAKQRSSPSIKEKVKAYEAKRDPKDELAPWRETLYGGDAADGRKIFYERAEAGCFRCHKVSGEGGDVGPELAGLAAQKGREYVLESILYPNKHIATGYESLNVTLKSGRDYAGLNKGEDAKTLTLNSPEDGILKLQKAEIARRSTGLSPMPEGIGSLLKPHEVRDLIEFISSAKPVSAAK